MSASEKRSLRERLRPKERKPAVRWLLTVLLLAAAVLGLHMLLQMIGTLDFSRGRFSSYLHVPKIYLLNLLPVALLVAFTYFGHEPRLARLPYPVRAAVHHGLRQLFQGHAPRRPVRGGGLPDHWRGSGHHRAVYAAFPGNVLCGYRPHRRRDDRPAPLGARPCAKKALVAPRSGAGAHRAAGLRCMGALVRQYGSL